MKVGIDFGTTYSVVACIDAKSQEPIIIKNQYGENLTPSAVAFIDGKFCFGEEAREQFGVNKEEVCMFFKRQMGNNHYSFNFGGKEFFIVDIASMYLRYLINEAEKQTKKRITSVVVTVPAYYTNNERVAAIEAIKKAGVSDVRLLNEPTSAIISYSRKNKEDKRVLVYDLGGGTFDVTVCDIVDGSINVLAINGNHALGGKDWNDCIVNYIISEIEDEFSLYFEEQEFIDYLMYMAEIIKVQLTHKEKYDFTLSYKKLYKKMFITRDIFEHISSYLLNTTKNIVEELLDNKNIKWADIDEVLLVGGATRMPQVTKLIENVLGKKVSKLVNPDEAVALGAVIYSNYDSEGNYICDDIEQRPLLERKMVVSEVIGHSLGVVAKSPLKKTFVNSIIIEKNTPIPCTEKALYTYTTKAQDNILELHVLEGENPIPSQNNSCRLYKLTDIQPVSYGETVIEVTYSFTKNGISQLTAKQLELDRPLTVTEDRYDVDLSWTLLPADQIEKTEKFIKSVSVVFAVDLSGSMRRTCLINGEKSSPLNQVKEIIKMHIKSLAEHDSLSVGVVAFADQVECVLPMVDNLSLCQDALERLDGFHIGGTNKAQPFTQIRQMLENVSSSLPTVKYAIVLTDGEWQNKEIARDEAKKCADSGIEIMAVGFGNANEEFIKSIASTERFATIVHISEVKECFDKIAVEIRGRIIE